MPPTLDVLEDVVRREYDAQERRADSLDTKAGLVLGFSGLLVSLTPETVWTPFALLARVLAAAAALLVLRVFASSPPRPDVDPVAVADDDDGAREALVATLLVAVRAGRARIAARVWRVRAALHLLTAAVVSTVVGAVAHTVWRW